MITFLLVFVASYFNIGVGAASAIVLIVTADDCSEGIVLDRKAMLEAMFLWAILIAVWPLAVFFLMFELDYVAKNALAKREPDAA